MGELGNRYTLECIETGKVDKQCRYFNAKISTDHKAEAADDTFEKTRGVAYYRLYK
jgi:hypothetical protein